MNKFLIKKQDGNLTIQAIAIIAVVLLLGTILLNFRDTISNIGKNSTEKSSTTSSSL